MWDKVKKKLASRKLWMSIIGFVTAILVACNVPEGSVSQVSAIISAFGSLVAYVLAEGYADGSGKGGE